MAETAGVDLDDLDRASKETASKLEKLGASAKNAASSVAGLITSAHSGGTSIASLTSATGLAAKAATATTGALSKAASAAGDLAVGLPPLAGGLKLISLGLDLFGKTIKLTQEGFEHLAPMFDAQLRTFRDLSSVGGLVTGDLNYAATMAEDFGVNMDQLGTIVKSNSSKLALFGGSVEGGIKIVQKSVKANQHNYDSMLALGATREEIADMFVTTAEQMRKAGNTNYTDSKKLSEATHAYFLELDAVARITGKNKKDLAKEREERQADTGFRAFTSGMDETQVNNLNDALSMIPAELQAGAKSIVSSGVIAGEQAAALTARNPKLAEYLMKMYGKAKGGGYKGKDEGLKEGLQMQQLIATNSLVNKLDKQLVSILHTKDNKLVAGGYQEMDIAEAVKAREGKTSEEVLKEVREAQKAQVAAGTSTEKPGAQKGLIELETQSMKVATEMNNLALKITGKVAPAFAKLTEAMIDAHKMMIKNFLGDTEDPDKKAKKEKEASTRIIDTTVGETANAEDLKIAADMLYAKGKISWMEKTITFNENFIRRKLEELKNEEQGRNREGKIGGPTSKNPELLDSEGKTEGRRLGGISKGPKSGYHELLHGTEAVVPLPDGKTIPVALSTSSIESLMQDDQLNKPAIDMHTLAMLGESNSKLLSILQRMPVNQNDPVSKLVEMESSIRSFSTTMIEKKDTEKNIFQETFTSIKDLLLSKESKMSESNKTSESDRLKQSQVFSSKGIDDTNDLMRQQVTLMTTFIQKADRLIDLSDDQIRISKEMLRVAS